MRLTPIQMTIGGVMLTALGVAIFTLAPRQGLDPQASISTSTDVTPSLTKTGVMENPPVEVTVNGQDVPVSNGTASVDIGNGVASVSVHGGAAKVQVNSDSPASARTPSNQTNVSVQTNNDGNGSFTTSSHSFTSSSSSNSGGSSYSNSFSNTSVFGSGSGHVEVNTSN